MPYYLTYAIVAIATALLFSIPLGLLLRRHKQKLAHLSLSTADFLPILACVIAGVLVSQLLGILLLDRITTDENQAIFDALTHAISVSVTAWGFYGYKLQQG